MKKVLFVCHGNICRSPAAEGILEFLLSKHKLADAVEVDSAGTTSYHSGENADARMIEHAEKRGYHLKSLSRKIRFPEDFERFDYILVMDDSNMNDIMHMDPSGIFLSKVQKFTEYCKTHNVKHVPDPYYGGAKGFEEVLDILEDACENFLDQHLK